METKMSAFPGVIQLHLRKGATADYEKFRNEYAIGVNAAIAETERQQLLAEQRYRKLGII